MEAKAKINLKDGLIELEGSEEFVSKHLEHFRELVQAYKKDSSDKGEEDNEETEDEIEDKKSKKKANKKDSKGSKPVKAKTIEPEKFDYTKDGSIISLQEFWEQKKPGKGTGNIIAVVGYYIQKIRKKAEFTEGNVDFAYRVLNLKRRPKHLHQIFINNKNQKDLFEEIEGKEGTWKLTRGGEIFVEEQLPAED
jgi:hypothetical protein